MKPMNAPAPDRRRSHGNMALENGKYYMHDGVIYKCVRDTGAPVYNALNELVGIYVETA